VPGEARNVALLALAALDSGTGVPLTRLAKQLDVRLSTLVRELAPLSDAKLGLEPGPGWVRLYFDGDNRWLVAITDLGRAQMNEQ